MKKQFIQAIFCPPTGAYEDKSYPDRLTDQVFQSLADAGINRIFGFGYDGRPETIEKTFELCDKYAIKYLPTPWVQGRYIRTVTGKNGEKPFFEMAEEEIEELDEQFLALVRRWTEHKSFAGIFFSDEAGYLAAEGLAHAKKIFDEQYEEYEFHTNFYSYAINDVIFWGGMGGGVPENVPFELKGDMAINFENRFRFYDCLVENLYSREKFEFMSQDKYPFETFWPTVPTSVHVGLFELNDYFNEKKKKYGCKFYNYMQVGQFDGSERAMTFAEMALQMHVTAAYGSEGFAYFPGCFPLDFVGKPRFAFGEHGGAALIDVYGHETVYYDWIKTLNREFFSQIEEDILSCEHMGVASYGIYDNGFTEDEINELPDNECIFRGELPKNLYYESEISIESSNEVMVSTFERDGKRRYYIVNLSTVYDNKVAIRLPNGHYELIIKGGRKNVSNQIDLKLDAGCGIYILER